MDLFETQNEQAVVGSMLIDSKNEVSPFCIKLLSESDFNDMTCRAVFSTIKKLFDERKPHDLMTVSSQGHEISDVAILATMGLISTVRHHANMVKTNSLRRAAIVLAQQIERQMGEVGSFGKPEEVIDYIKTKLDLTLPKIERKPENIVSILDEVTTEIENAHHGKIKALKYGIPDLDKLTGGIWPSELTIIAGGPGSGKTAYSISAAINIAKGGGKVHFCSLEMNRHQVVRRMMARTGHITGDELKEIPDSDERAVCLWDKIRRAQTDLQNLPITVDETSNTIQELVNKATNMHEAGKLDILIVDYLQLLTSGKKHESRRHEVEHISRQLKLLTKNLNIPVFALSQMTREGQKNTKPRLSDLRESGAIEQDADIVIFLWDDNAEQHFASAIVDINLIVAKQRNGRTAEIKTKFHRANMRFTGVC